MSTPINISRPLRVAFLWQLLPSYLAACINSLREQHQVDLRLFALGKDGVKSSDALVEGDVFPKDALRLLSSQQFNDYQYIDAELNAYSPDIIVVSGWSHPPFRKLLKHLKFKVVLVSDNTFKGTLRQYIAKFALRSYFQRVAAVMVPGDRGAELMKFWSVPGHKIYRGVYSIDFDHFAKAGALRNDTTPRRKFLFVGRLEERKGIHLLLPAYQQYRKMVNDPWALDLVGRGHLQDICTGPGVNLLGFKTFDELPAVYAQSSVFVFPSIYDSWGVALAEAAAAGLPSICSTNCGVSADVICDGYNGRIIEPSSTDAILKALLWYHNNEATIDLMGQRAKERAAGYSGEQAAKQWMRLFTEI